MENKKVGVITNIEVTVKEKGRMTQYKKDEISFREIPVLLKTSNSFSG